VVVKRLHALSLESGHSLELAPWLASELAYVEEEGFRLARPVATQDGRWMLEDGWAAWTFVDGRPVQREDIPEAVTAIRALHRALRHIEKHPLLDQNTTAWGVALVDCLFNRL
jgi:cytochrome oxidase assembly protein ShyY1